MGSGLTNVGKQRLLEMALRNTQDSAAADTQPLFLALITSAVTPSATILTFGELTEIAAGNGYTSGGDVITRDGSDLTVWDNSSDTAGSYGRIQLKNFVWTASGGNLPSSGSGASFAVLLDDNATVSSRQVYAWFDLSEARTIGSGAKLTLVDIEIRLT